MFGLSTGLIVKGKLTLYGGQIDKPNIRIVCWLDTSRTPPCRAKERMQSRLHVGVSLPCLVARLRSHKII